MAVGIVKPSSGGLPALHTMKRLTDRKCTRVAGNLKGVADGRRNCEVDRYLAVFSQRYLAPTGVPLRILDWDAPRRGWAGFLRRHPAASTMRGCLIRR
ncbi:MAG: hypothetical protein M0P31_02265 [Solirubrobacteraceae bacterium]|nr:hypothetical protein [Solirubrobacteraceae bacterium]